MGKCDFLTVELRSEVICEHNGMVHVALIVDGALSDILVVSEPAYKSFLDRGGF